VRDLISNGEEAPRPKAAAPRGAVGNVVGGFVAGLYSVPEGIGYASLAGVNPMLGIYSGMVPVAAAAATVGSALMMSTLTSAIALTMGGIIDEASFGAGHIPQAVVTLSLLAGVIMFVLGALKLGRVINFVSNAVMTGFVIGVAILIVVGKFGDIFGFEPDGFDNKVVRALDILSRPGQWDGTTTAVGLGTIGAAFALKSIAALERYALVIVVIVGTATVWFLGIDTKLISDVATIETGLDALPIPNGWNVLPDLTLIPDLWIGSIAIAIVALAQGAGIRPAFPNPDGSRASASRDFIGQGVGNLAGALFQSAPSGGSLSRTAVSEDGGASSRLAGFVAAGSVVILVVGFGSVVGHIPEAVIGGLLLVIGIELVIGRIPDARLAWTTGRTSRVLLVATLCLTLVVPLQWAIIGGAGLSLIAYVGASSGSARLRRIVRDDVGWLVTDDVPTTLPAGEAVLLRYTGPNFFAAETSIFEDLPKPQPGRPGVLVFDIGALRAYSSTMLKGLERYVDELDRAGGSLVLLQVEADQRRILERVGLLDRIGPDNVLAPDPHLVWVLEAGLQRADMLVSDGNG
jgi:SulP family sulfate permease